MDKSKTNKVDLKSLNAEKWFNTANYTQLVKL